VKRNANCTLVLVLLVAALFVTGCAAGRAFRRGDKASMLGDWDAAVIHYRAAVQQDPDRADFKIALERAMQNASRQHLARAREFEEKGQIEEALFEYRKGIEFDPANRMAAAKAESCAARPGIRYRRSDSRRYAAVTARSPASSRRRSSRVTTSSRSSGP